MDLDISKYSCQELQDIFNINNLNNFPEIETQIDQYKNNILTEVSLSYLQKNNITDFLNKALDKLTLYINKNVLNPETSDNHPIIVSSNTIAGTVAQSYKGRNVDTRVFPPGYINPINIKTIKKLLILIPDLEIHIIVQKVLILLLIFRSNLKKL